ncbi:MAG: PocR ligand-binding domain-containing protein [Sedimentisphaerales bacterium]|nr:PocR ligand-binding domain-containing protein [Sedimentisphaerales bacterium]
MPSKGNISFVEAEYRKAISEKIPCLVYFKDEQTPVLPIFVEQETTNIERLKSFKSELKSKHVVSWFSTPQDLARIVATDLHKYLLDNVLPDKQYLLSPVSLTDIIPRAMLELVLEGLSQRFQIPIGIFAPEKDRDFYFYPSHLHFSEYCKMIRGTRKGMKLCYEADRKFAWECMRSGKPTIYKCHTGLIDFAVPIYVGGNNVGAIFAGQVVHKQQKESSVGEVSSFAREIGVDEKSSLFSPKWLTKTL